MMALPPTSANRLQHIDHANLCFGKQPIVKVLQMSQEISQILGGSLETKFLYWSLLKVILLHLNYQIRFRGSARHKARRVLQRHGDATSITCHARYSATVMTICRRGD